MLQTRLGFPTIRRRWLTSGFHLVLIRGELLTTSSRHEIQTAGVTPPPLLSGRPGRSWESCWQETLQTVQQGQGSARRQQGWFCYSMSAGEAHRAGRREELLPGGGVWSGLLHSQPDGVLRPHGVPVLHRECPSVQVSRSASTWNDRKLTGR